MISKTVNFLKLMRPHQWIKNLFVGAPLFFSFEFSFDAVTNTFLGFICFSLAASTIYTLNDLVDIKEDQEHPTKKFRPLASGLVSKNQAIKLILILLITSLLLSSLLTSNFFIILIIYFILNLGYSFGLKHISLIYISIIAIGFVLRVLAGAVLIETPPSMWIIISTFVLSLFLALAKRRDDCILASAGKKVRKNIDGYNLEFVNTAMMIMATITLVSYIMYTVSDLAQQKFHTHYLFTTTGWVILGILRYLQLTLVENNSGNPTKLLLKDKVLQISILAWLINFYIIAQVSH